MYPPPAPAEPVWTPDAAVIAQLRPLIDRPVSRLATHEPMTTWLAGHVMTGCGSTLMIAAAMDREREARFDAKTRPARLKLRKLKGKPLDTVRRLSSGTLDLVILDADRDPAETLELLVLVRGLLRPGGTILVTGLDAAGDEMFAAGEVTGVDAVDAFVRICTTLTAERAGGTLWLTL